MPEAILQKSFVKYVRMEDEKDVDEFYDLQYSEYNLLSTPVLSNKEQ